MPSSNPLSKSRRRSYASLILETHGVSQAKLADALGVSPSSLSRMLRGVQPTPSGLEAVLRAAIGRKDARQVMQAVGREATS